MSGDDRPRRSWFHVRPGFRRAAIVVSAILLVVLAHRLWDYIELRRVVQEMERMRERGEPLSASDIRSGDESPLAVRDGGDYYAAAAMLTLSTGSALKVDAALAPLRGWMGGVGQRPQAIAGTATGVLDSLGEWRAALDLVDEAVDLPFRAFPPGAEFTYRAAGLSNLSRLAADRTLALSLAGDGDRAVESAISAIRLRRALRDIFGLSRGGHEVAGVLSFSRPSAPALARLQQVLEDEEQADAPVEDFLRERARYLDRMILTYYGRDPRAQLFFPPPTRRGQPVLARPLITHEVVETLDVWAELIDAARRPWPGRVDAVNAILARYPEQSRPRPAADRGQFVLLLTLARTLIRPDSLILDRSARIAIAVERFRRDTDALPARLDDLVPAYLDAVPDDPLTGRALLYTSAPDAYVIYSVGPDLQDNGGALLKEAPATSAAPFVPADDIGIRVLLDPELEPIGAQPDSSR